MTQKNRHHYIIDTASFVVTRGYYLDVFPSFWSGLDNMVKEGTVSSVSEVYEELRNYQDGQDSLFLWAKKNKSIFTEPPDEELRRVKEIFKEKRFRLLVSRKQQLSGKPVADPFLIAKAISLKATVITEEKKYPKITEKTKKLRIPEVCEKFNVPCMSLLEMMTQEGLKF